MLRVRRSLIQHLVLQSFNTLVAAGIAEPRGKRGPPCGKGAHHGGFWLQYRRAPAPACRCSKSLAPSHAPGLFFAEGKPELAFRLPQTILKHHIW